MVIIKTCIDTLKGLYYYKQLAIIASYIAAKWLIMVYVTVSVKTSLVAHDFWSQILILKAMTPVKHFLY